MSKKFFITVITVLLGGIVFAQTANTKTSSDTTRANTTTTTKVVPKRKIVKVATERLNATYKAPEPTKRNAVTTDIKENDIKPK